MIFEGCLPADQPGPKTWEDSIAIEDVIDLRIVSTSTLSLVNRAFPSQTRVLLPAF
jgi:hypothetical protein